MCVPTSSPHRDFVLYLSKDGDSVEILNEGREKTGRIPEQQEAAACNTQDKVLAFLEKHQTNDTFLFYHYNHPYFPEHGSFFRMTPYHACSPEAQIKFLKSLILPKPFKVSVPM